MAQVMRLRKGLQEFRSGSVDRPDPHKLLGEVVREHFAGWLLGAAPQLREPDRWFDFEVLLRRGIEAAVSETGLSQPVLQLIRTRGEWGATLDAAIGATGTEVEEVEEPGGCGDWC